MAAIWALTSKLSKAHTLSNTNETLIEPVTLHIQTPPPPPPQKKEEKNTFDFNVPLHATEVVSPIHLSPAANTAAENNTRGGPSSPNEMHTFTTLPPSLKNHNNKVEKKY